MVEVLDNVMDIPPLKWDIEAFTNFGKSYDKQRDLLSIYRVPKRPAVSLDVKGHFWIRFDPETGDVLGLEFEDFEQVFLVHYPELKLGWTQIKSQIDKRRNSPDSSVGDYLRLLMLFAQHTLDSKPSDDQP